MAESSDLTSSVFAALSKLQINNIPKPPLPQQNTNLHINVPKPPLNNQNSIINKRPDQGRNNNGRNNGFNHYKERTGGHSKRSVPSLYSRNTSVNRSTSTIKRPQNSNFVKSGFNNVPGAVKSRMPNNSGGRTNHSIHNNASINSHNSRNTFADKYESMMKNKPGRTDSATYPHTSTNLNDNALTNLNDNELCETNKLRCSQQKEGENYKQEKAKSKLHYKKLEELVSHDSLQIAIELANTYNGFQFLLKQKLFLLERPDWIILITQLLVKVCQCDYSENKITVLSIVCETNFIDIVVEFLIKVPEYNNSRKHSGAIRNLDTFLRNIILLLEYLVNIYQIKAKELFHAPIMKIFGSISSIEVFTGGCIIVDNTIKENFKILEDRIKKMESLSYIGREKGFVDEGTPPDDFRTLDLYPGQHEILLDSQVFLRRCIVDGSYNGVEHYLDVQFRLLRQDFIAPVREGFKVILENLNSEDNHKKKKRVSNVRLFKYCSFIKPDMFKDKPSYVLCFDTENKINVRWEYNKWFMFGSLLFFSFDNFSSFFLGTVVNKDSKTCEKHRTINVELLDKELTDEDFSKELFMVESTIFFLPYYHVMKALKELNDSNFPMPRYIVEVNPVIEPPAYMQQCKSLQIDKKYFDVFNDFQWPTPDHLGLDNHQFEAFKSALTKEFAIMQGPPGTGKTYLGLKIVETLLKNDTVLEHLGAPILLVCYTNHALDQFLEGILKFTKSIVRVGSQTKSEHIKPYELKEVRRKFAFDKGLNSAYLTMRNEMKAIQMDLNRLEKTISMIDDIVGIIGLDILKPVMSDDHINQLKSSTTLVQWLLESNVGVASVDKDLFLEDDNNSTKDETENQSNEDSEEEEESRKQHKNDYFTPLFDASELVDARMMGIHIVTQGSLKRILKNIENDRYQIENQSQILEPSDYSRMRWHVETKLEDVSRAIENLLHHFKKRAKNMNKIIHTESKRDLMQMNMTQRWNFYWQWVSKLRLLLMTKFRNTEVEYKHISERFSEARELQDIQVLRHFKILGTTTTKAAQFHMMFTALRPKVVIVEEAAEVLESHIVTSLTNHCEHLILIGDHQQLRPNPTVYELAKKYNLEISLFERMIKNDLSFSALRVQHRMRPEICDLITPTIYPKLENHSSVFNYEHVKGVSKNLFFISHDEHEELDNQIDSHKNPHEGDFVLKLAEYLLLQGYLSEQITILVTYSGQLINLKMRKKDLKSEGMRNIRITTVDNYQGEECEIILLSLVRSNADNKIGFLATPNRVCVALSRAKHGLYIIGNMVCLENGSQIWPEIKGQLEMHDAIGPALQLECQVHKNKTLVSKKIDFLKVSGGGCNVMCDSLLQCGHFCKSLCHPHDLDHKQYKCPEKCTKSCPDGHPCANQCYEVCNLCHVLVTRKFYCGHSKDIFCYIDPNSYLCEMKVMVDMPLCAHTVKVSCYKITDGNKIRCPKPCPHRVSCGHACSLTCHLDSDPDHINFKCMKPCERKNKGCTLDHFCGKRCFENCSICNERVSKLLPCGHRRTVLCHTDENMVECDCPCSKVLPCNHICKKLCKDICGEFCNVVVEKTIAACGHKVKIECSVIPERENCIELCGDVLSCGHPCSKPCRDKCSTDDCVHLVDCDFESICGHPAKAKCKDKQLPREDLKILALESCPEPCQEQLLCSHICGGTCSGCKQGRLHEICKEKCGRVKICGHSCNIDCSALCPPCKQPCLTICRHSQCNRPCGEKCAPCLEKCPWRCPHKKCNKRCWQFCNRSRCYEPCWRSLPCGHDCIGFCGEPCPDKCRVCNKDEVEEIFFGTEDKKDARFVVLEDCGHFFESEAIEYYLGAKKDTSKSDQPDREIVLKTCPKCKTPIASTLRFMNIIREVMKDIIQVKKKQNGMRSTVRHMKLDALGRLQGLKKFNQNEKEKEKFLKSSKYFFNIIGHISRNIEDSRTVYTKGYVVERANFLSETQMHLYVFIIEIVEDIKARVLLFTALDVNASSELLLKIDEILGYVIHMPDSKISQQQHFDLRREIERFYAFANLVQLKITHENLFESTSLKKSYENCLREIQCLDKFDKIRSAHVNKLLEDLKSEAASFSGCTKEEYKMIFMAMKESFYPGNEQGHFFKCRNGHMYCITECGGAMEMAKCPVQGCYETIGGTNHRYVAGTSLASEVDGATAPAWKVTLH